VRIVALFIGKPRPVTVAGATFRSGGAKTAVASAILRLDGFDGDGPANLKHHGGRDRTACVYPLEHYAWWKAAHGYELGPGSFAENLSVEGALEDALCIGDVVRVGEALVQVSLPRDPCGTLDRLTGIPGLGTMARAAGRCGFHMRTLEEGLVRGGDTFAVVERDPAGITVAAALDLYHGRSHDTELARRLFEIPALAEQGRREIGQRIMDFPHPSR
jgi:MOSC domain-containing protein YiiM